MNIAFGMILRELYAQKRRIFLTILAIAWGTASIAGMLSVGEGLRQTFGRGIASGGSSTITIDPGYTSIDNKGIGKGVKVILSQKDVSNIKLALNKSNIKMNLVEGIYSFVPVLSYKRQVIQSHANAVTPRYLRTKGMKVSPGGRFLSSIDEQNQSKVVVLGNKIAENLFEKGVDPLNKKILLGGRVFKVVGVIESTFKFGGRRGSSDAYLMWIPQSTYKGLSDSRNYNQILLSPKFANQGSKVDKIVRRVIALRGGYNPQDPEFLQIKDSEKTQETLKQVFLGMQVFLGIIGGITLLVAGIGIANVMFLSVKQSIKEIGIQIAIGARSSNILAHYVFEGLVTTFIGGILGLLLVKLIIYLIGLIPVKGSFFAQIGAPKPVLSLSVIVAAIIVLGFIGFLSALFPAIRASRIAPAVALRES